MNREIKIWASDSEEGWLLPSDADSWHCSQTLELKSSSESKAEDAFFNQVVALSQAGLLLLANAKKNAIYVVHLEYGSNPEATHMDYIAEFTVTMPILSFTGTSDLLPHGEQIVQVYCVQTQAIQQYALDLSQCLPPPIDSITYERQDSNVSRDAPTSEGVSVLEPSRSKADTSLDVSVPTSYVGSVSRQTSSSLMVEASIESPPVASSPTLSRKVSDLKSPASGHESGEPKIVDYSVDRQVDTLVTTDSITDKSKVSKEEGTKFKHPTHLVTPAELMATSSSEISHVSEQKNDVDSNVHDVVPNSDSQNVELEVKVVGEMGKSQLIEPVSQGEVHGFASQASDFGSRVLSGESYIVNESKQVDESGQTLVGQNEIQDAIIDLPGHAEPAIPAATIESSAPVLLTKGKKQKGKNAQGSNQSSPSQSVFNSVDTSYELGVTSSVPSADTILSQLHSMQEIMTQVNIYIYRYQHVEIYKLAGVLLEVR